MHARRPPPSSSKIFDYPYYLYRLVSLATGNAAFDTALPVVFSVPPHPVTDWLIFCPLAVRDWNLLPMTGH